MRYVKGELNDHILTLTLNRPEKKNAVNTDLLEDLGSLCERFQSDPELRVVILRGEGGCFCAGADLTQVSASNETSMRRFHDLRERVFGLIEDFPCPTVAAIESYALGTGLELSLCTDFRVASEDVFMGIPSSRLGIVESYLYLTRLVRAVGLARANFLVFTGVRLTAEEAQRIGLVERIFPREVMQERVQELARTLVDAAPGTARRSKRVLKECAADPYLHHVSDPALPMVESLMSAEMREGTQAFLNRER